LNELLFAENNKVVTHHQSDFCSEKMKKICFVLIVILLFVFSVQSKEHALEALFYSYATYTKDEKEIRQWTCGWCQKISDVT
jgi:hypothetical protein